MSSRRKTHPPAIWGWRNYTHGIRALRLLGHISKRASVIFGCSFFRYVINLSFRILPPSAGLFFLQKQKHLSFRQALSSADAKPSLLSLKKGLMFIWKTHQSISCVFSMSWAYPFNSDLMRTFKCILSNTADTGRYSDIDQFRTICKCV